MSTETENLETQKKKDIFPADSSREDNYKIFDFFMEHNGLLVTCISALTATISIILHYAVGRMNYAYLEYWNIASLHANTSNQNELYIVACTLLSSLSILLIHSLLSGTSDAFRYYNKLLSRMNLAIKKAKKTRKKIRKQICTLSKSLDRFTIDENKSFTAEETKKQISKYETESEEILKSMRSVTKERRTIKIKVVLEITIAIIFSYLLGSLFLILLEPTVTIETGLRSTQSIIYTIIFYFLIYFLPAYLSSRCSNKQYKKEKSQEIFAELIDSGLPDFPIEKFFTKGIKPILSDKKLKTGLVKLAIVTVVLLFTMSAVGTVNAKQKRNFSIYTDGTTSYAIVYFSGSTVFLEEASCQDGTIVIDTSKQRIITTDDLSYDVISFKNVTVNRPQDVQDLE